LKYSHEAETKRIVDRDHPLRKGDRLPKFTSMKAFPPMIWHQKTLRSGILGLWMLVGGASTLLAQSNGLTEVVQFGSNPGNLKMFVHKPPSVDAGMEALVVVLHGCGQTAADAAQLTGWNKLADLYRFVVVYPQQKFLNNPNLCFNWFNPRDITLGQGEGESIFQMIAYALPQYAIDSQRVFVTGLSAGAAMSVVLMATHPATIRSGAIFAGGAYHIATNPLQSAQALLGDLHPTQATMVALVRAQNPAYSGPYPYLTIYQGNQDPIVHRSNADLLLTQWAGIHGIDTIPDQVQRAYAGIQDLTRKEFADSSGKTIVVKYEVNNMGHRVLVKPGNEDDAGGKSGTFGMDKGFHSTYQTAQEFGLIPDK
jgi:poly(hydroxyalkanoate) depolymerase family esterase